MNNLKNFYEAYAQNIPGFNPPTAAWDKLETDPIKNLTQMTQGSQSSRLLESRSKPNTQFEHNELDMSLPARSELVQRDLQNNFSAYSQHRKENRPPDSEFMDFERKYLGGGGDSRIAGTRQGYQRQDFDSLLKGDNDHSVVADQKIERSLFPDSNKKSENDFLFGRGAQFTEAEKTKENASNRPTAPSQKQGLMEKRQDFANTLDDVPIKASGQYNYKNFDEQPIKSSGQYKNFDDQPIKSKFIEKQKTEEIDEDYSDPYRRDSNTEAAELYARKNSFDEVPINGKPTKRFEELLEEQLRNDPSAMPQRRPMSTGNTKKTFLKRGTRQFLSSAAARIQKKEAQSKTQDSDDDEPSPKNTNYNAKKTNFGAGGSRPPQFKEKEKERNYHQNRFQDESDVVAPQVDRKPHKFLAKGEGVGGGKGNIGQSQPKLAGTKKTGQDWKSTEEEYGDERKNVHKATNKKRNKAQSTDFRNQKKDAYTNDEDDEEQDSFDRAYNHEKYLLSSEKKGPFGHEFGRSDQGFTSGYDRNPFANKYRDNDSDDDEDQGFSQQNGGASKYFNMEKGKSPKAGKQKKQDKHGDVPFGKQSEEDLQKIVNEKIEALNSEIAKFKLENERVKKIRQKHEDMLKDLNNQIEEFQKSKEQEEKEFKAWKEEEIKKIREEKKAAAKIAQVAGNVPNRKERDEIEALKEQLAKCQEEMKNRDQRNKLIIERQKKQIEELLAKNAELQPENKFADQAKSSNTQFAVGGKQAAPSNSSYATKNYQQQQAGNSQDLRQQKTPRSNQYNGRLNSEAITEENSFNDDDETSNQGYGSYDPFNRKPKEETDEYDDRMNFNAGAKGKQIQQAKNMNSSFSGEPRANQGGNGERSYSEQLDTSYTDNKLSTYHDMK